MSSKKTRPPVREWDIYAFNPYTGMYKHIGQSKGRSDALACSNFRKNHKVYKYMDYRRILLEYEIVFVATEPGTSPTVPDLKKDLAEVVARRRVRESQSQLHPAEQLRRRIVNNSASTKPAPPASKKPGVHKGVQMFFLF